MAKKKENAETANKPTINKTDNKKEIDKEKAKLDAYRNGFMKEDSISPLTFEYHLKIPHERLGVLIGEKGKTKRGIEKLLNVKLKIDSQNDDVFISGEDSLNSVIAQNAVKAIGRGFNPETAMKLADEDYVFETLLISDYCGKSKKKLIRMRGRVIGADGKARQIIEDLSGANAVIYGKTICLIGDYSAVGLARKAFESLLAGARHATVYAWLEKNAKELKRERMF